MSELSDNRVYEVFDLNSVIREFPPDPESKAKHRAEILVKSNTLRVVVVTAVAGGFLHEHSAPGPITVQVLEGKFTLTIDNEPRVLGAGDIAVVSPDISHGVVCDEDGAFLLTIAHLSRTPDPGGEDDGM
jgi:quercetin dioxygenase-like cupin family protein